MSISKTVLLVLGRARIPAVLRDIEALTATGVIVDLVVTDLPEWERTMPGVTVHRVPAGGDYIKIAAPLLADASELVIGDPPAIIPAWALARRRPDLPIRFEPNPETGRQVRPTDLAVVTPWYPSPNNAMAGAFVQAAVECLDGKAGKVSIMHAEDWSPTPGGRSPLLLPFADRMVDPARRAVVTDTPAGELVRVPVLVQRQRSYADWAEDHADALRGALPTGQIEAPLIHAHTGIFAGVAAMRLARPDARIVITEHATFLAPIFAQPHARDLYDQALHRADVLLCVGEVLLDEIAAQFPWHRPKLRIIPNPVDFERFTPRAAPPDDLKRWLYVGRFNKLKRVDVLLEAFGVAAATDPELTLSMVGAGDLLDHLHRRVRELCLGDRVAFSPQIPAQLVPGVMRKHDLLVHTSSHETFGLTAVEAVATATPVLATRTAGSAETLSDIEHLAGALMEVTDGPEAIAASFAKLRARQSSLDVMAARQVLMDKYDRHAVGARFLELYEELLNAGDRVLVLALGSADRADVLDFIRADERGVDLVVADRTEWVRHSLPSRVHVFDLGVPSKKQNRRIKSPWPTVARGYAQVLRRRMGVSKHAPVAQWPGLVRTAAEVVVFDRESAALLKNLPGIRVTQRFE